MLQMQTYRAAATSCRRAFSPNSLAGSISLAMPVFSTSRMFCRPVSNYFRALGPQHMLVRNAGGVRRNERQEARAFVEARGYSPEVAEGIVDALMASGTGITAGTVLSMVKSMAGRWEVGEDNGLIAMAKAVEQELALTQGKKVVKFFVSAPSDDGDGSIIECEGLEGMSLKAVVEHGVGKNAQVLGEYIECACDGIMACSTCHVYINEDWVERVGQPSENEQDMLDLAYNPRETSRLGCQLVLSPELDGLQLEIPRGANNLFDHIPFS